MSVLLLLIDSDIAFMVNIKKALEDTGEFHVSLATNPSAAADTLRRVPHDLAVVDFDVPDRDVMELLRLLRNTQPGLPVIITPHDDVQHERAQYLDVQGVIERPFTARQLIPYVRDILGKRRFAPPNESPAQSDQPGAPDALRDLYDRSEAGGMLDERERRQLREQLEFLNADPDSPAGILEEFEAMERAQTGPLDSPPSHNFGKTRILGDSDEPEDLPDPGQTRYLGDSDVLDDDSSNSGQTQDLGDWEPSSSAPRPGESRSRGKNDPPRTDALPSDQDAETETGRYGKTDLLDEPARKLGDTPPLPGYFDTDEAREYLGIDKDDQDSPEFGDVLDAVAQSGPADFERSPHDRAFHDLVDSMRGAEPPEKRRSWLDDLLSSIASDAARGGTTSPETENALDIALNAIRRGAPPETGGESELDDTTIGEVIGGFERSFEGVLAALSGEEIDGIDYEEPSYTAMPADSLAPQDDDRITPDEMSSEDLPAWLADYEPGEIPPPLTLPEPFEVPVDEPPTGIEDSSLYPATTALSAAESDSDFSLDDLLNQIDLQIPTTLAHRPQLKPLPSWGHDNPLGAPDMRALFDRAEGVRRPPAEPVDRVDAVDAPAMFAEDLVQDTRPSPSLRDEIESADFQERDTQRYGPIIPDEGRARPIDVWEDSGPGDDIPQLSMDDLMAIADLPDETGTEEIQRELARRAADASAAGSEQAEGVDEFDQSIAEAFYAGVREQEDQPIPIDVPEPDAPEIPVDLPEEMAGPDDSQLIPVPVEEAARLLEGGSLIDEDAEIAQAAVQLTQFSLESSAQMTMLSRGGRLLASAGDLPEAVIEDLFETVRTAWQTASGGSDSLIRFVNVAETGDFLLYSVQVENGLTLSMIFHADTPVRAIRRQARRLSETLELVPEAPEHPAASTLPSRPTGLKPPAGLHDQAAVDAALEAVQPVQPSSEDEGPYTAYTCMWLPYDPGLELTGELVSGLSEWLHDIARENVWDLDDLTIWPDYVLLSLRVPQKLLPDDVIMRLMEESSRRSAEFYPELVNSHPLWSTGYYVVSPPRELTDREIARFMTYYRQAQH